MSVAGDKRFDSGISQLNITPRWLEGVLSTCNRGAGEENFAPDLWDQTSRCDYSNFLYLPKEDYLLSAEEATNWGTQGQACTSPENCSSPFRVWAAASPWPCVESLLARAALQYAERLLESLQMSQIALV